MTRALRPLGAVVSFVVLFGAAAVAHAQDESPDRLIDRGIEARSRGRDAEALALFEQAHRVRPTALSLAQIALAEQALGRWLEADEHLRAAMAMDDRWVVRNRATLDEALETISQHVGLVQVDGTPAGARVTLAEREIGTLPMATPARVLVGRARLSVRAEGHDPVDRDIDVQPNQPVRETVALRRTGGSDGGGETTAPERRPARRPVRQRTSGGGSPLTTIGIVGLGVGGAAIITGTIALVMREGHAGDWNSDACLRDGRTRSDNCQSDLDAGETAELVSIIGFAAGGAIVAGSVVMLIAGGSSGGGEADEAPERARILGCGAGPGSMGVSCAGRF